MTTVHSLLGGARLAALTLLLVVGCTVYQTGPESYSYAPPSTFDRAWAATLGAFDDQGVRVVSQDRAGGTVRGTRDSIEVSANLRTQADGSVRVELNRRGGSGDPGLLDRISRAYDRRMGR